MENQNPIIAPIGTPISATQPTNTSDANADTTQAQDNTEVVTDSTQSEQEAPEPVDNTNVLSVAMQSIDIENEKYLAQQRSEEAQQEWVNTITVKTAKEAAYDEDTFKKTYRIGTQLFKEKAVNPLNETPNPNNLTINAPDSDVYVMVIAADNLHIPKEQRLTAEQLKVVIQAALEKEFSDKQGWRMALLSIRNSTNFVETFFRRGGFIETFFKAVQGVSAAKAGLLPHLFKTAERPKRVVNPTRPYQPRLYSDPEIY